MTKIEGRDKIFHISTLSGLKKIKIKLKFRREVYQEYCLVHKNMFESRFHYLTRCLSRKCMYKDICVFDFTKKD